MTLRPSAIFGYRKLSWLASIEGSFPRSHFSMSSATIGRASLLI